MDKFIGGLYRKLEEQIFNEYHKMVTITDHEWIGSDLHAYSDTGTHYLFKNLKVIKKTEDQKPSLSLGEGRGYAERMELIDRGFY